MQFMRDCRPLRIRPKLSEKPKTERHQERLLLQRAADWRRNLVSYFAVCECAAEPREGTWRREASGDFEEDKFSKSLSFEINSA